MSTLKVSHLARRGPSVVAVPISIIFMINFTLTRRSVCAVYICSEFLRTRKLFNNTRKYTLAVFTLISAQSDYSYIYGVFFCVFITSKPHVLFQIWNCYFTLSLSRCCYQKNYASKVHLKTNESEGMMMRMIFSPILFWAHSATLIIIVQAVNNNGKEQIPSTHCRWSWKRDAQVLVFNLKTWNHSEIFLFWV